MTSQFLSHLFQGIGKGDIQPLREWDSCLDEMAAHFHLSSKVSFGTSPSLTLEESAERRYLRLDPVIFAGPVRCETATLPLLAKYRDNTWHAILPGMSSPSSLEVEALWQCFPASCPSLATLRHLIGLALTALRGEVFLLAATGLLAALGPLSVSLLAAWVLHHVGWMQGRDFLIFFVVAWFFLFACSCVSLFSECLAKNLNTRLLVRCLPGLWLRLLDNEVSFYREWRPAELTERLAAFEGALGSIFSTGFAFALEILAMLVLVICLLCISSSMAFFSVCLCGVNAIAKGCLLPRYLQHLVRQSAEQGSLAAFLQTVLFQMAKIRSVHAEERLYHKWLSGMKTLKRETEQVVTAEVQFALIDPVVSALALLVFCGLIGWQGYGHQATGWLTCLILTLQLMSKMEKASASGLSLCQSLPALWRMKPLLERLSHSSKTMGRQISLQGGIRLECVSLKTACGRVLLNEVEFVASPEECIAITGPSGAGKSSLLKLILGLIQPDAGKVLIDGVDTAHLDPEGIRSQLGVVLQTTCLMPGSIFSNLAATASLTLDQAWELVDLVGLREEINAMPMKLLTQISDHACESLSGGQRQKLLIARALAGRPKILLLDEATSALDTVSERRLHDALNALNITRIVVSHRPVSFLTANRIYHLENGQLQQVHGFEVSR